MFSHADNENVERKAAEAFKWVQSIGEVTRLYNTAGVVRQANGVKSNTWLERLAKPSLILRLPSFEG